MKPFSHQVRRTHLYLALFCLPWFVMYGVTAFVFNHNNWFRTPGGLYDTSSPAWTEEGSWPCTVAVPEEGEIPRAVAAELLGVAGLHEDAYGAFRSGANQVEVYIVAFWKVRRLTYRMEQQRLSLYRRSPLFQQVLTGMHARSGYQHDGFLNDAWAVMVDVVSVGFLLWVITGMYIWWQMPGLRMWGFIGLGAGLLTFVAFLLLL